MIPSVQRADVEKFRAFVSRRVGPHFEDDKLEYLADVLRQRMQASGCPGFGAYEGWLDRNLQKETRALAEQLTISETYFFRYGDHFRAFVEVVLPERTRAKDGRRRLNVLSAGCASGEEAYSLAILIREHVPDPQSCSVKLQGIDINPTMVERAGRARYLTWSLRETSPKLRASHFRPEGREFQLHESVRELATFHERNLLDDDPLFWHPGAFDVVFCRNVLMYFSPETMRAVVARIHASLAPGGFLFLGHAETLRGTSQDFHLRHTHETFYYQRREAGEGGRPEPAPRAPEPGHTLAATPDLQDASWVDAIHRSSDRIAELASASPRPSQAPAPAPLDLRPAVELLRSERFDEAMDLLHALPSSAKDDPDAQLLRAVLLTNGSKLREAEQVCAGILAADELNAGAHYLMALCREHAGDRGAAFDHAQTATYLDAGFAMPHLHLGLLARRAGDLAQARAELGRALELLAREDASRILLFGGGFSREALVALCRSELRASGGGS